MGAGELVLSLTGYSAWQSEPLYLDWQYSGTGGLNAGEPAPRFEQAGQLTLPPADGDISQSSAGELTLVV